MYTLQEISLLQVKQEATDSTSATFVIEPLSPGFGLTVGNALRRVLLSSLPGAAITSIRIDGVSHEFSTIKGVRQDVVDIILNLKQLRLKLDGTDSQVIILDVKGEKKVTGGDFKCPAGVQVVNKDLVIAELVDGGKLLIEATVEAGRGYVPTEMRKEDKLPIGVISIDAAFSPITKVNFQIENTRVGKMTNFDKLVMEVQTDGSLTAQEALEQAAQILVEHFSIISGSPAGVLSGLESATDQTGEVLKPKSATKKADQKTADKPKKVTKKAA